MNGSVVLSVPVSEGETVIVVAVVSLDGGLAAARPLESHEMLALAPTILVPVSDRAVAMQINKP